MFVIGVGKLILVFVYHWCITFRIEVFVMKLKVFREYSKKKQVLFVGCLVVILFMAAIYIYRTYAIYQEREDLM